MAVPVMWTDEGMVKRIRGVTFSTRVSVQFENTMVHSARGIVNHLLPDVRILTDHKTGPQAGDSPGYGMSLVAETITGCCIAADSTVSYAREEETVELEDEDKKEIIPPVDVALRIASTLLAEIEQGGVVDSTHQMFQRFVSPYGIETLRNIRDLILSQTHLQELCCLNAWVVDLRTFLERSLNGVVTSLSFFPAAILDS